MRPFSAGIGALALALMFAGAAHAEKTSRLVWTGYGAPPFNGSGENHCFKYQMHVIVLVQPGKVSGSFQQKGRPKRHFTFPTDGAGNFSGVAPVHGGKLEVKGSATPAGGKISLYGYCLFTGDLKKR